MALPQRPSTPAAASSSAKIEQFIGQGGTPPKAATKAARKKPVHLLDFHDPDLLARLDEACRKPIKRSRNQWILEAVVEKLERDGR
jgi:hypothetical protein